VAVNDLPLLLPALLCALAGYFFAEHAITASRRGAIIKAGAISAAFWIGAGVALAWVVLP
jgi:hypothetical protein